MNQPRLDIKIVLAEDEPMIATAYQKGLTYHGFDVTLAGDGKEALEVVKRERPDILLLDIIMPIMNGTQVLETLMSQPEFKDLPVIVLTNLGQPSDANRVIELGAKAYLIKANISLDELVAHIYEALRTSQKPGLHTS